MLSSDDLEKLRKAGRVSGEARELGMSLVAEGVKLYDVAQEVEGYIRAHYKDIKAYANVAEQRLDDSDCTLESLLWDNAHTLEMCRKHGVPYTLIEDSYQIEI